AKLFVTSRALAFRRAEPAIFERGAYVPLEARGERARHVVAFARVDGRKATIAAAGRFFLGLGAGERTPVGREAFGGGALVLPRELSGRWRDVLTGRELRTVERAGAAEMPLASVFSTLPA